MKTVSKRTCLMLACLLHDYGVRRAVVSPGTRCAPIVSALHRSGRFEMTTVVDERCAAFIALGMAARSGEPVALVCTSGSAMLNHGPALAEAYYRNIPLIAVTADRPAEWIDQLDGQTIRQPGALSAVMRRCVDIPPEDGSEGQTRLVNRLMNEALQNATAGAKGPVQINIQLTAPLVELQDMPEKAYAKKIGLILPSCLPDTDMLAEVVGTPENTKKVLLVLGGMHPAEKTKSSLKAISSLGAMVLAESQANVDFPNPSLFEMRMRELPAPDLVVCAGGPVVSARLKAWLRGLPEATRFVCVGDYDNIVDTYSHCTAQVRLADEVFFASLAALLEKYDLSEDYRREFMLFRNLPDTDDTSAMLKSLLRFFDDADVHFGNGMAIRYAQSSGFATSGLIDCNRGVNGIDGSTSTAIGASMVSDRTTLLVTGDMSAAYDIGALATAGIPASFKMAVLNNGGGDIFRRITTTRDLPERELYYSFPPVLPLRQLAEAYGFGYFSAEDPGDRAIGLFAIEKERPAILEIKLRPYDNGK